MKVLKLILVLVFALMAVIAVTWIWIQRIGAYGGAGAASAVDISYVVTRPLYLLEVVFILALALWVCWRWVFA